MENFWNRAALALRPFALAAVVIAGPVFLLSYLYALKLMFNALPIWAFALVWVSHLMVWIGMSLLHDQREERRNRLG